MNQTIPQILCDLNTFFKNNSQIAPFNFFCRFDENNTTKLNRSEFQKMLQFINKGINLEQSNQAFDYIRQNVSDEEISFRRIQFILNKIKYEANKNQQAQTIKSENKINIQQEIRQKLKNKSLKDLSNIFDHYDLNQSGFLEKQEFHELILNYVKDQQLINKIEQIFNQYNSKNNNRGVNKADFHDYAVKKIKLPLQLQNLQTSKEVEIKQTQQTENENFHKLQDYWNSKQQSTTYKPRLKDLNSQDLGQIKQIQTESIEQAVQESNIFFQQFVITDDLLKLCDIVSFSLFFSDQMSKKEKFVDPEFMPNKQHLGGDFQNLQWIRATELFQNKVQLFTKDQSELVREGIGKYISPKDIKQGKLGDCYILSALSSLASEWPDLILRLFMTQSPNEQGVYILKICINGQWKPIFLDDFFPVKVGQDGRKLAFSKSHGQELWVLLIEKLMAKLAGSYYNIENGSCISEVLRMFTGAPTFVIRTDASDFLTALTWLSNRSFIMTASSIKNEQQADELKDQFGILQSHSYSVMGLLTLENGLKLIKLRNPWGSLEWKGDWSYQSPCWTQDQRDKYLKTNVSNGEFYIGVEDFKKYFVSIDVCLVMKNYEYSWLELYSKRNRAQYIAFEINNAGRYNLTINQTNKRFIYADTDFNEIAAQNLQQKYVYSPAKLIIAKIVNSSLIEFQEAYYNTDMEVYCLYDGQLSEGTYVAYCKVEWTWTESYKFVVSLYGPENVELHKVEKIENYIENAYIARARKNINKNDNVDHCYEIIKNQGIAYFYYKNNCNRILHIQLDLSKSKGIKLRKNLREKFPNNQIDLDIHQNEEIMIIAHLSQEGAELKFEELIK